jgi:hypothetical protein
MASRSYPPLLCIVSAVACDDAAGPEPARAVGVNDTVSITDTATGSHDLALDGIASNCAVTGENPRFSTVDSGATTRVLLPSSAPSSREVWR